MTTTKTPAAAPAIKKTRHRRTKAQIAAARAADTTKTIHEAAAKLEEHIQVAPPSDLLGKTSRAIMGKLATEWPTLLNENHYPLPFSINVRVIGREAEVEIEYTRTIRSKATVVIDDGEQDLNLGQSQPGVSLEAAKELTAAPPAPASTDEEPDMLGTGGPK